MPTNFASMSATPWYREPWPWFLMAGPAIVVVAGFITYGLAARTENALVVDNYYKEGLAINRVLDADRRAQALALAARVDLDEQRLSVQVDGLSPMPQRLRLRLIHPTQARFDMALELAPGAQAGFGGALSTDESIALRVAASRWQVRLEDDAAHWRLTGEWNPARESTLMLRAKAR